jgi:zinc protease
MIALAGKPAAAGDIFPYPLWQEQIDNGLKVVMIPYDCQGLISFYTVVRTGSRNEVEPGHSGFAHLFEHIMFRGTKKYPAEEYNKTLKRMGTDDNAFTSDDLTCYHITGSKANLEIIMEIESDRFMNLSYSEEDFKTETGAVLGEYRKNFSNPINSAEERIMDLAFDVHTYKHTTMGFLKDIEAMPAYYDYSLQFHRRYYRPDNCTIIVVGDFERESFMALVRKYYGAWEKGAYTTPITPEPPQKGERRAHVDWKVKTLPLVLIGYHMPAFLDSSPDVAALHILSEYLFSSSSPLYQKIVMEEQKADFLFPYMDDHRDPYLLMIYLRGKKNGDLPALEQTVYAAIEDAKRGNIPKERIRDIASNMRYSFAASLDTPDGVAYQAARAVALADDPRAINRYFALLETITPQQVQEAARKYLTVENRSVVTLTFRGEK